MELFQELGDGDGGEVVGLHRSRRKVIQGFIYLKLNYLFPGAPTGIYCRGYYLTPARSGSRQRKGLVMEDS